MALISRASRMVHGFLARIPGSRVLVVALRTILIPLDIVLAAFVVLVWLLTVGLFRKLIELFRGSDRPVPVPRSICFLSQEGFAVAPTRIRTYYFADRVGRLGIQTKVLAFWDHIYGVEHRDARPTFAIEHVFGALIAVHRLLADPPAVIVQQRPNYELITTSAVHWLLGTPVIFDVDDWILDDVCFYGMRVRKVLRWFRYLAPVCVVSSSRLEQELSRVFSRVVTIPTFADTDLFRPRSARKASDEVVFGWNGTFFETFTYDSVLLMIRAFCLAHDRVGDANPMVLEIAGTGAYLEPVKKTVSSEFANYPIRVRGWIDPRTMNDYLDGIDVGLYSLKTVDQDANPWEANFIRSKSPTKVFEYMAKGIPTISTRIGEVARFVEEGVTGYCSDDVDELADAFATLATDSDRRAKMGAAARRQGVDYYSLDAAGAMYADVITEVCGLDPRGAAHQANSRKPDTVGVS